MDETSRSIRWFRLGTLAVAAAALAAIAFLLRSPAGDADARPLFAHDKMQVWEAAGPAVKQATAESLLDHLRREGKLGPQTASALHDPDEKRALLDQLVAALDAATDRDRRDYVSPADSIARTAEAAAKKSGWDK
jgi:hypothetical protein